MKSIIPIIALFLVITSCANSRKQLTAREAAISLIEKEYPANGRRLEYSQVDSTDAEIKGYTIWRMYIGNDDTIRNESFHLNYNKDKIKINFSHTVHPLLYKSLLLNDKVYTDDRKSDWKRINRASAKFQGIDNEQYHQFIDSLLDN